MRSLRGGPRTDLGHHRRPLLPPRRALPARHPPHQPHPADLRRPDHGQGPLPGPDSGRAGRVRRSGRRGGRATPGSAGGRAAGSGAALLGPAAPLVPPPPGGAVGDVQHSAVPAPHGRTRHASPPALPHRPGRAARVAAHPLRDGGRHRLPVAAPGRRGPGGTARHRGGRGHAGGGTRPARRAKLRSRIRTALPGRPLHTRGRGTRPAGGDAPHRLRRLVHHPAAAGPHGRLHGAHPGWRPHVGAAAGPVRRLHPLAAGTARGGR
ncbi:hypothetical protein EES39_39930 [Streptomyces sp. ADI92-24]|nr:hypothetical protein EES39_39930 [Streptomyces sp. ADI92-24]